MELSKVESPEMSQLLELKGWLRDPKGGGLFLDGAEAETWTESNKSEYVSVGPPVPERDVFTTLLRGALLDAFHFLLGERLKAGRIVDEEAGLVSYDDSRLDRASSIIAAILSSVVPVLTIFALNAVQTIEARIGMIVIFTGLFSAMLAIFSSAKRIEIFAATSTLVFLSVLKDVFSTLTLKFRFAAIEVVYVGTALSSSQMT